ncbi:MAG: hypothetical protein RLY61_247 [Candidatus Parcubacteria bacterium]|jgi:hypothetical protein
MTELAQPTQSPDVSKIRLISISVGILLLLFFIALYFIFFLKPVQPPTPITEDANQQNVTEIFHEGKIEYVDTRLYPGLEITHALTQSKGDIVLLLKADDAILEVGEGHWAKVYGSIEDENSTKYPIFKVSKVVIRSNSK